jgi:YesN/AraC family two-component response regulator
MVCETVQQLLASLEYKAFYALNGKEALAIYSQCVTIIDLFIIDMIMPGMTGLELYFHIKDINPKAKTILCSGYGISQSIQEVLNQGCDGFLQKPFSLGDLSKIIEGILIE